MIDITIKPANFLFDKDGVIIITDVEHSNPPAKAEMFYDGKNCVVLNRDNKDYYGFKNIAPSIRTKLLNSQYVTVVEKKSNDIRSYEVKISKIADIGVPDDYVEFSEALMEELKEKLGADEFEKFLASSREIVRKMEE